MVAQRAEADVNLDQIRLMTRAQLDLDDTDLPDALLDNFVRDGYERIINMERRWPFFEQTWTVPVAAGDPLIMPIDLAEADSLVGTNGKRLHRVTRRWAEDRFNVVTPTTGTTGGFWYPLGRQIYVLPNVSVAETYQIVGFRLPSDWVSLGASAEVDADPRLHMAIVWYACSAGYAQQEDEVLEQTYMNRFRESAGIAHDAVMHPWSGQPRQVSSIRYGSPWGGYGGPAQLVFQLPPGP